MKKAYWKRGDLALLARKTKIRYTNLHDIVRGTRRVSLRRAAVLEKVSARLFPRRKRITMLDWLLQSPTHPAFQSVKGS